MVGDFSGNAAKIIDSARQAQSAGAGLILFPELSVCGYPPRDLGERSSFVTHNRETAERIAAETRGIAVVCGLVEFIVVRVIGLRYVAYRKDLGVVGSRFRKMRLDVCVVVRFCVRV